MPVCITCKTLDETENLAKKFANLIADKGAFVCLLGDVGAGKTAFSKFVCKYLGVREIPIARLVCLFIPFENLCNGLLNGILNF